MNYPVSAVLEQKEKKEIFSVPPSATVLDAVQLMNREKIGSVLVVHDGTPVGIFTERDVLVRVVAQGRDATTTRVDEVMTGDFVGLRLNATVDEALQVVTAKRCRHLPVIGEGDKVVGRSGPREPHRRTDGLHNRPLSRLSQRVPS
jgi:CBS domain-containing protein